MTNNFVGTWNAPWTGGHYAAPSMTILADGTGTYTWPYNGTLKGTFDAGNRSFSGTWTQSNDSGPFTMVLAGTSTLSGVWGNRDGRDAGGQWTRTSNG